MRADVLTQRHRAQQIVVARTTVRQVAQVWPALDWANLDASYPDLARAVAPIVASNRRTSTALAAAYSKAIRAKHVRGQFQPVPADALGGDQFNASLQATSVAALKSSASRGVLSDAALSAALTQTVGAMSRLVLDAGRSTVTRTSTSDPRCRGWQRIGVGECAFCQMLLGRGAVYTEDTASFEAHDHCTCSAEPVYG